MTRCGVLSLVWPGGQSGDGLVGRMTCTCGRPGLFRLFPTATPFEVEGARTLHVAEHSAPIWLLCHALLNGEPDVVAHVSGLQENAAPAWLETYARTQGCPT